MTAAAGLPVPPGFVVTTDAYRRLAERGIRSDPALRPRRLPTPYRDARRRAGRGAVERHRRGRGRHQLRRAAGNDPRRRGRRARCIAAIERCWRSLHTDRAVAYRAKQGVDEAGLAMAVVVQRLVPAEVAGVLFTRDPLDPTASACSRKARGGWAKSVVSGRVSPIASRSTARPGAVLDKHLGLEGGPRHRRARSTSRRRAAAVLPQ